MAGTLNALTTGVMDAHGIVFDPGAWIGAHRQRRGGAEECLIAVAMRPAVFLRLAPPLAVPRPSLQWISAHLNEGQPICPPSLRVWVPQHLAGSAWRNIVPAVVAHDGRHRMLALHAHLGPDAEVPVHVALPTLPAGAAVPAAVLEAMRRGMRSQGGARAVVPGPLFSASDAENGALAGVWVYRPVRAPPDGKVPRRHTCTGGRGHGRSATRTRSIPSIMSRVSQMPGFCIINESCLWSLVLTSWKPAAKGFKRWTAGTAPLPRAH